MALPIEIGVKGPEQVRQEIDRLNRMGKLLLAIQHLEETRKTLWSTHSAEEKRGTVLAAPEGSVFRAYFGATNLVQFVAYDNGASNFHQTPSLSFSGQEKEVGFGYTFIATRLVYMDGVVAAISDDMSGCIVTYPEDAAKSAAVGLHPVVGTEPTS